jgi:glycosyltransferase involved in cell wall biosynthesis
MKVSVVIPAYNEEHNIGACLDSIHNQTQKAFEVIVVDNNSTDNTAIVAKEHGAKVVFEAKRGIIPARDRGFNEATGDVIVRTDADTIVPRNWISKISHHFEDKTVDRLAGGSVFYRPWMWPIFNMFVFWDNDLFGYKALFGPNFAIRKSAWDKVKNELCHDNVKFHEDLDLAIHLSNYGRYARDYSIKVDTSTRRVAHISSFFIDYPLKWVRTVFLKKHRRLSSNPLFKHL